MVTTRKRASVPSAIVHKTDQKKSKKTPVPASTVQKQPRKKYLQQFKKFETLCDDLRWHALSYCYKNTLYEYALCSKNCNRDIERFNTVAPIGMIVDRVRNNATRIILSYANDVEIVKICEPGKIGEVMRNSLRHARNSETIWITVNTWRDELMTVPEIVKIPNWKINITKSSAEKIFNFVTALKSIKKLTFVVKTGQHVMPASFFKTEIFQNLAHMYFGEVKAAVTDEDFLRSKIPVIGVECGSLVTETAMNQKIRQWLESDTMEKIWYQFNKKQVDLDVLIQSITIDSLYISRSIMPIKRADGETAEISVSDGHMKFKTNNWNEED